MKGMNTSDQTLLRLERAADELRRGQPVVVAAGARALLVLPLELTTTPALARFDDMVSGSFVMLTNNRALSLKVAGEDWAAVRLERPEWMTAEDMVALADPTLDLASPLKGPYSRINHPATDLDEAAIKIVKWARLLPAV